MKTNDSQLRPRPVGIVIANIIFNLSCCIATVGGMMWVGQEFGWVWAGLGLVFLLVAGYLILRVLRQAIQQSQGKKGSKVFVPPEFENDLRQALEEDQRYQQTGQVSALDAAVAAWERIFAHPSLPQAPERTRLTFMNDAGGVFLRVYLRSGQLKDLEHALHLLRQAVQLTPSDSPDRATRLNNLSISLVTQYFRTGMLADLEEAVRVSNEAVQLAPSDSSELFRYLGNLGTFLGNRYLRTGALADLDEAIRSWQQAQVLTPFGSPGQPLILINLGNGLRLRYLRTRDLADMEEAIRVSRKAVQLTPPGSPESFRNLNNLANALRESYLHTKAPADLEEAIRVNQQSVQLTPPDSPELSSGLSNLSNVLCDRYNHAGMLADLEEAIRVSREAVRLTPHGAPGRCSLLNNLGNGLYHRYGHTGMQADLEEAIQLYEQACQCGSLHSQDVALTSSRTWGHWALERQSWQEAYRAYAYGLQASELLFQLQLDRQSKEAWLKDFQGIPANAAYAQARLGQYEQALTNIESGRTRLLREVLERSRRDLEHLAELGHGDLLQRYRVATTRVDALTHLASPFKTSNDVPASHPADLLQQIEAARLKVDGAIAEIRHMPGYEGFLLPLPVERIQALAVEAPLVYIATTPAGSLALVVSPQNIQPLWLDFKEAALEGLLVQWDGDTAIGGYLPGQIGETDWLIASLKEILPGLGERVMGPLAEHLRKSGIRSVTLIPTGKLSLLPLHAASYTIDGCSVCFLDEFDVAYAQSAQALAAAQAQSKERQVHTAILAGVGNPLPNPQPLPFAQAELEEIATFFGEHVRPLYGKQARKAAFLQSLPGATHIHLSCHGSFDPEEPLASGLYFANQELLTLSEVLDSEAFSQARLVVLSACQTAITDFNKVPDEAIGLPGGFLQAGIPGVVGTLWSVNDMTTALIMIKFYEFALRDGMPYPQALCAAQRWLRDATAGELLAYFKQHKSLHYGQLRLGKQLSSTPDEPTEDMLRFELQDPSAQPFRDQPYHWAPFVYYGV